MPWRTTDGRESDYYSVLLTSIVIEGAGSDRSVNVDVDRIGNLLEELANRGRVTRRPTENDPGIALHIPGMRLRLIGSEKVAEGPRLEWTVSSYTLLVLKRVLKVAQLLEDSSDQDQVPRSRRPDLDAHRAPPDRSGQRARPVG